VHVDERKLASDIARSSGADIRKCMKCGKCSGACPNYAEMDIHPHKFVSMIDDCDVSALLASKSIWKCLSCFACVERCPRGVKPANIIEAVRSSVLAPQGQNRLTPEDVPEFMKSLGEAAERIPQQLLASAFRKYSR
jgi:heterodisulfide reductase subunit C